MQQSNRRNYCCRVVCRLLLQAIRLLSQLAARLPDMVHLLQPHMDDTAAIIIRQGFAMVGAST